MSVGGTRGFPAGDRNKPVGISSGLTGWSPRVLVTEPARIAIERVAIAKYYAFRDRLAGIAHTVSKARTPLVLLIEDMAAILRTSRSTIERRRRAGTFPLPELPSLDKRPRWSRQAVEQFLSSTSGGLRTRRGRPRR